MNRVRDQLKINYLHQKQILGSSVTVAVLDTGIYPHPDIRSRIAAFTDCVNGQISAYDDNSHGSHVCGIIAGDGFLSRGLYRGIAPECRLIAVKVLDHTGHGSSERLIRGVEWVIANYKRYRIRVVNISIGMPSTSCMDESSSLVQAVDHLWELGIFVIASAGNNGPDYQSVTTPGISRKVVTVGTVGSFVLSGKGPTHCDIAKPDIVAPGSRIVSLSNRPSYEKKSGTSMSTPIVSGVAALALSYSSDLTNDSFKRTLCITAEDLGKDRYTQGCGLINPVGLLSACQPFL